MRYSRLANVRNLTVSPVSPVYIKQTMTNPMDLSLAFPELTAGQLIMLERYVIEREQQAIGRSKNN